MKRTLLYSGVLLLVLFSCWLLAMADTPALLIAYTNATLPENVAQWVVRGAWIWVAISAVLSLAKGCALTSKVIRIAAFRFPPHWILPLSTWGIGILVTLLTGNISAGVWLGWSGIPWLAVMVGQSLRCSPV